VITVRTETMHGRSAEVFDADSFETTGGYLILRKDGMMVAAFAAGYWASVEKEPPAEPAAAEQQVAEAVEVQP